MGLGKDGAATAIGYVNSLSASVYGTALEMSSYSEAKICASITESFSATEIVDEGIGCGNNTGFSSDVRLGQKEYRVGLSGNMGVQNGFDRIMAQFFGAETVAAEATVDQDDYKHVFKFASLSNQRFGTLAWETSTDSVIELPSTYTQRIQISMAAVEGFVTWAADVIGNTAVFSSTVNSNAELQALTLADDEKIFSECVHTFRMKSIADDGTEDALDSGDQFNITSFDLEMETPLEVIKEMTGGACGAPSQSGAKTGTLTIGIKQHTSNTNSYIAWANGTYFMAEIEWKGKQIGTGLNKSVKIKLPKLALVNSPGYSITNAGKNPYTMVLKILQSINTMPGYTTKAVEIELVNKKPTVYLAT